MTRNPLVPPTTVAIDPTPIPIRSRTRPTIPGALAVLVLAGLVAALLSGPGRPPAGRPPTLPDAGMIIPEPASPAASPRSGQARTTTPPVRFLAHDWIEVDPPPAADATLEQRLGLAGAATDRFRLCPDGLPPGTCRNCALYDLLRRAF